MSYSAKHISAKKHGFLISARQRLSFGKKKTGYLVFPPWVMPSHEYRDPVGGETGHLTAFLAISNRSRSGRTSTKHSSYPRALTRGTTPLLSNHSRCDTPPGTLSRHVPRNLTTSRHRALILTMEVNPDLQHPYDAHQDQTPEPRV